MAADMGAEIDVQNRQLSQIVSKDGPPRSRGAYTRPPGNLAQSVTCEESSGAMETLEMEFLGGAYMRQTARMAEPVPTSSEPVPKRGGTRTRQTARRSTGGKPPRMQLASVMDNRAEILGTEDEDAAMSATWTRDTAGKSTGGTAQQQEHMQAMPAMGVSAFEFTSMNVLGAFVVTLTPRPLLWALHFKV